MKIISFLSPPDRSKNPYRTGFVYLAKLSIRFQNRVLCSFRDQIHCAFEHEFGPFPVFLFYHRLAVHGFCTVSYHKFQKYATPFSPR